MESEIFFTDLQIEPSILQAIEEMGFTKPSPIQAQAIPILLQGIDCVGQAKTGTGKTAAFGIPAIQAVDTNLKTTQVLVLCPTRELAMQVNDEIMKLAKYKKGIRCTAVFGGASMDKQIDSLKRGSQIVVGTPGRIMDHIDRGTLKLENIRQIILDEADEMLDMGFRDDIEFILSETPSDRQTIFFSATMAKPIMELTKKYLSNPQVIKVMNTDMTVELIDQRFIPVKEGDKIPLMGRLIDLYEPKLCLVFCNTKRMVDEVVERLQDSGYAAEALHGDMRQMQRTQVMAKFRQGKIQILAATDVAARGIDVNDIELVVNYDIPLDTEYYVHRIGRTGRAGKKGVAISLVSRRDSRLLRDIEHAAKTTIKQDVIPSLEDIEKNKHAKFILNIKQSIQEGDNEKYIQWINELQEEGFAPVDVAAALIKLEYHHIFSQYEGKDEMQNESFSRFGDRGGREPQGRGGRDQGRGGRGNDRFDRGGPQRGPRGGNDRDFGRDQAPRNDRGFGDEKAQRGFKSDPNMTRLFLNVGRDVRVMPKEIIQLLEFGGLRGKKVGNIDIYDKFSFVEVDMKNPVDLIIGLNKTELKGVKIKAEVAKDKKD